MKIVLIGYMASGKTHIGKALAHHLHLPFLDLDSEMEEKEGMSISEIFEKKGEIYFRRKEPELLKKLLDAPTHFVLATGGGTPCYGNAMAIINSANAVSFYLKASIDTLLNRVYEERSSRPLIAHLDDREKMAEFIGIHLFERSQFYNQADFTINVNNRKTEEIVAEIAGLL